MKKKKSVIKQFVIGNKFSYFMDYLKDIGINYNSLTGSTYFLYWIDDEDVDLYNLYRFALTCKPLEKDNMLKEFSFYILFSDIKDKFEVFKEYDLCFADTLDELIKYYNAEDISKYINSDISLYDRVKDNESFDSIFDELIIETANTSEDNRYINVLLNKFMEYKMEMNIINLLDYARKRHIILNKRIDELIKYSLNIKSKLLIKYLLLNHYREINIFDKSELLEMYFNNDNNFESEEESNIRKTEENEFVRLLKFNLADTSLYFTNIDILSDIAFKTNNKDLAYYILLNHRSDLYTYTYDKLRNMLDDDKKDLLYIMRNR